MSLSILFVTCASPWSECVSQGQGGGSQQDQEDDQVNVRQGGHCKGLKHPHGEFLLQMTRVLFDFTSTAGHQEIQSTRDKGAAYLLRAKLLEVVFYLLYCFRTSSNDYFGPRALMFWFSFIQAGITGQQGLLNLQLKTTKLLWRCRWPGHWGECLSKYQMSLLSPWPNESYL